MMRAKFICGSVGEIDSCGSRRVDLSAVCSDENLENQSFNKATPDGTLSMSIDNPKAQDYFKPGKEYYRN